MKVSLIGAGPGDPGLITVRGLERLRQADVVIFDALSDASLLEQVKPDAILIDAGKRARHHKLTQDEINSLLAEHASAGRCVVRLKGGDPYLFGRGGEEAIYLAERGLACEIVPGITSGLAAPAAAGIPATYRGVSSSVTLITGHETPDKPETQLDYASLAGIARSGGTLCFYMGVGRMPAIMSALQEHGLSASVPAAVVQWGTLPRQRHASGTIATIAETCEQQGITSPAIIVVGDVAGLQQEALQHFIRRPLFGKKVLVTRTRAQASDLSDLLREHGAEVLEAPTLSVEPNPDTADLDRAAREIDTYDWLLLTSVNAIDSFRDALFRAGSDMRAISHLRVAAVGRATADTIRERLGITVDLVPDEYHGRALASALIADKPDTQRALLWRADIGGQDLPTLLRDAGWEVDDVAAYVSTPAKTLPDDVVETFREGGFDWITFTSSSTVRNLCSLLRAHDLEMGGARRISIGPVTTTTLEEAGFPAHLEAKRASVAAVVERMIEAERG